MSDSQAELNVLFPQGKTITIGGEEVTITPFTFGQLPQVMKVMKGLAETAKGKKLDASLALDVFSEAGDDIIILMAKCIGKDIMFITSLQQDEGIALMLAFLEVNADFFIKKVLPMLKADMKQVSLKAGLK